MRNPFGLEAGKGTGEDKPKLDLILLRVRIWYLCGRDL